MRVLLAIASGWGGALTLLAAEAVVLRWSTKLVSKTNNDWLSSMSKKAPACANALTCCCSRQGYAWEVCCGCGAVSYCCGCCCCYCCCCRLNNAVLAMRRCVTVGGTYVQVCVAEEAKVRGGVYGSVYSGNNAKTLSSRMLRIRYA